jgi:cytosine/adenosine deaminase-related metal-dependent hydrolase
VAQRGAAIVICPSTEANLGEIGFDAFVEGIAREYRTRGAETVKGSMAK